MPANTPRGLPYPLPTEPVAEGAQAIRNLAEAVDPKLGGELAYEQIIASVPVTATAEATSQGVVAAPPTVFDGAPVIVEFYAPVVQPPQAAAAGITLYLSLDGAIIGILGRLINPAANVMGAPVLVRRRLTPTAGTHTFVIGTSVSAGTGNISAGPGGSGQFLPAYIRISRL